MGDERTEPGELGPDSQPTETNFTNAGRGGQHHARSAADFVCSRNRALANVA